jgi:Protein of unknown function (DUF3631)
MSEEDKKIVEFPKSELSKSEVSDEEKARRIMVEVDRLTRLAPGEWKLWYRKRAQTLDIAPELLSELIEAKLKDLKAAEKKAEAEKRRQDQRVERQRRSAERDEGRKREKDQRAIEKAAERKSKERAKAFADISKLPSERGEAEIERLAELLGEDVSALRDDFSEYSASTIDTTSTPSAVWDVEAWPEPVVTAVLLRGLIDKINQHIALRHPHEALVIALWVMMAWVHEVAIHSTFLVATSAEPDSGKSTLLGVLYYLTPKPVNAVEVTAATVYRLIDREKATFILDEADDLFKRKVDLSHIFNAAWDRSKKVPRMEKINGVSTTVWFSPFSPKIVGLLGMNMPRALRGRCIVIKTWPKRLEDKQEFNDVDDEVFAELRRKLARWSTDNAAVLKDARPLYPAGFINRLQVNWRLLLAIVELAGGSWPKQAREAAERISRTTTKPSYGLQSLQAFQQIFASGRTAITSQETVAVLTADPDSVWCEYNHGGPITQRQVAAILEPFDIHPIVIHPTGRSSPSPRGYKLEQFRDAFARFLRAPSDPHIRTQPRKRKNKEPNKRKKKK